jgi:predicted ATPase
MCFASLNPSYAGCEIVMATHSPMLMAYPGARLLRFSKYGLEPVSIEQTGHLRSCASFVTIRRNFAAAVMAGN